MKKDLLNVRVFWLPVSKEVFFEGEAESVSSENQLGKFDVLPQHANFISLIFNEVIIVTPKKEKIVYHFEKGVLTVRKNEVRIFLGL
jgi:F0F1-type ATP synthase epsilon subunit